MKRRPAKINCLIAINKPKGITSHDVVARVRRAVGERRVGHAGTLDPLAEGVLIVGIGQATKLMGHLTQDKKSYIAEISFGSETDTEDAEGKVIKRAEMRDELSSEDYARELLAGFLGPQRQVPPIYSAISIDGRRAYDIARSGESVELKARDIEVFDATLVNIRSKQNTVIWTVAYTVSKGTYIRSLARDLGRAANNAAHLTSLIRTSSGGIGLSQCISLDELEVNSKGVLESFILDPVDALKLNLKVLNEPQFEDVRCGRTLKLDAGDNFELEERVGLIYQDKMVAVWQYTGYSLKPICNVFDGISGVGKAHV